MQNKLLDSKVFDNALKGNLASLEDIERVLTPDENELFLHYKSICEKGLPAEDLLLDKNIYAIATRFASSYNWSDEDLYSLGLKQNALYCVAKLYTIIDFISLGKLTEAQSLSNKILVIAKNESHRDEAQNILAYISLLKDDIDKAAEYLSSALDTEYTDGLVQNSLYVANFMEGVASKKYIKEVLSKATSQELREKALYLYLNNNLRKPTAQDLDEESDNFNFSDMIDPDILEHSKEMFMAGCALDGLRLVIKIIAAKDVNFFDKEDSKSSSIWNTVECQYLIYRESEKLKISNFFKNYTEGIRKSKWVQNDITEFITMFADMGIESSNSDLGIAAFSLVKEVGSAGIGYKNFYNILVRAAPIATIPSPKGILSLESITYFINAFDYLIRKPEDRNSIGEVDLFSDEEALVVLQRMFISNVVKSVSTQYDSLLEILPYVGYRNHKIRAAIRDLNGYFRVLSNMSFAKGSEELEAEVKSLLGALK